MEVENYYKLYKKYKRKYRLLSGSGHVDPIKTLNDTIRSEHLLSLDPAKEKKEKITKTYQELKEQAEQENKTEVVDGLTQRYNEYIGTIPCHDYKNIKSLLKDFSNDLYHQRFKEPDEEYRDLLNYLEEKKDKTGDPCNVTAANIEQLKKSYLKYKRRLLKINSDSSQVKWLVDYLTTGDFSEKYCYNLGALSVDDIKGDDKLLNYYILFTSILGQENIEKNIPDIREIAGDGLAYDFFRRPDPERYPHEFIKIFIEKLENDDGVISYITNIINKFNKDSEDNPFWKRLTTYFYMEEAEYDGEGWGIIKDKNEEKRLQYDDGNLYDNYIDYEENLKLKCSGDRQDKDKHLCPYFARKLSSIVAESLMSRFPRQQLLNDYTLPDEFKPIDSLSYDEMKNQLKNDDIHGIYDRDGFDSKIDDMDMDELKSYLELQYKRKANNNLYYEIVMKAFESIRDQNSKKLSSEIWGTDKDTTIRNLKQIAKLAKAAEVERLSKRR